MRSDYHKITFGYNPNNGHYTLSWAGYSVDIDISKVGTYTIGNEATGNFITVTFDPAAFFREDTLVASPSGLPPEDIKLGDKLDLAAKLRLVEASVQSLSQTARGTLDATLDGRVSYRPERKGNGN